MRTLGPFLIGAIGFVVVSVLEAPIGRAMGWYNPLTGYMAAEMMLAAPLGPLAAIVARRWRGVLYLIGGFAIGGGVVVGLATMGYGSQSDVLKYVVLGALLMPFVAGFLAVPLYLVTQVAIVWIAKAKLVKPRL